MYQGSNTTWFNRVLFSHKDNHYGSNSNLEIVISGSTQDFKSFYPLSFDFWIKTIDDYKGLTCKLKYQDVLDLLESVKEVLKDEAHIYSNGGSTIEKRYNKDRNVTIRFGRNSAKEFLVGISIKLNEAQIKKVVMNLMTFKYIIKLMKDYADNYITYNFQYPSLMISNSNHGLISSIENLIKQLPSQLVFTNNCEEIKTFSPELVSTDGIEIKLEQEETNNEPAETNEFNDFFEKEEKNIKIQELETIESPPKQQPEVLESNSIYSTLFNNTYNTVNSILNTLILSDNPLNDILSVIRPHIPEEVELLPGITNSELKSFTYLSKLLLKTNAQLNIETNKPYPITSPILKITPSQQPSIENINLAFDLLTIVGWTRCYFQKLHGKQQDVMKNGSALYYIMRTCLDPLIFSYVNPSIKIDVVQNAVLKRYKELKETDFFKDMNEYLRVNNSNEVSDNDLISFITELYTKVIQNDKTIDVIPLHGELYKSKKVMLPPENDLTIEQIIKATDVEVLEKINKKPDQETLIKILGDDKDEIIKVLKNKEVKPKEPPIHIERFLNENKEDIIDDYKEFLSKTIKKLKTSEFDPKWIPDFDSFGFIDEKIIKALYKWKPDDTKITYTEWLRTLEKVILTKSNILILWKEKLQPKQEEKTDDWF